MLDIIRDEIALHTKMSGNPPYAIYLGYDEFIKVSPGNSNDVHDLKLFELPVFYVNRKSYLRVV